jgi:D-serine deaminase-like pyridoxal phosphate-dependent protein
MNDIFPELEGLEQIRTPALLFIEERIEANIKLMLTMVGGDPARLRPHVKTHKTPEIVSMQMREGITKFKASTLAEAELCAARGAKDVLIAYPLQGPAISELLRLRQVFKNTTFSMLVDSEESLPQIKTAVKGCAQSLDVFLDIDCGMQRTGITPDARAMKLYGELHGMDWINLRGLHAYDGHLHDPDTAQRSLQCEEAFSPVIELREKLEASGMPVGALVAGGSPTFATHASHPDRECSPGTTILWDFGYGERHPELGFQCAAFLLTRVVSKPAQGRICLDLGHKSVAPEMPHPRVRLQGLEEAAVLMHSEEHLVLQPQDCFDMAMGSPILGVPRHVCPTVSMHNQAIPYRKGKPGAPWKIAARGRDYAPAK